MFAFLRRLFARPSRFPTPEMVFRGPMESDPAKELLEKVKEYLESESTVARAYFLTATYGVDAVTPHVVLAIRSSNTGWNPRIARRIGDIFRSMFAATEELDILFLDEPCEKRVSEVVSPFLVRA